MPDTEIESRLARCFRAVFPKMDPGTVRYASTAGFADWDSVATVTLLNLVAEEFSIEVDWDRLEELNSYNAFFDMIRAQVSG
jgi:acyl carrier protein